MSDKLPETLLELDDLAVHFRVGSALKGGIKTLKAVDGVSLDVKPGECLGLVGESGCGKSTLALAIMGLIPPTHGHIRLNGHELCRKVRETPWGRDVLMVAASGWGQQDDRQRSMAAGFDHHLVKPVDYAAVDALLAARAARVPG